MTEHLSDHMKKVLKEIAFRSIALAQMYARDNPPEIGSTVTHVLDIDRKYQLTDIIAGIAYVEYVDPETETIVKNEFPYNEVFEPDMAMEFMKLLVQQRLDKWNLES